VYLLDSTVIDAYFRRKPHKNVQLWFKDVSDPEIFINVMVITEAKRAIERGRRQANCNVRKLKDKENILKTIIRDYSSRILPIVWIPRWCGELFCRQR
jgi:predicted nucleic acid-binding protein